VADGLATGDVYITTLPPPIYFIFLLIYFKVELN